MLYDTLIGPFIEFEFMRRALAGVFALAKTNCRKTELDWRRPVTLGRVAPHIHFARKLL